MVITLTGPSGSGKSTLQEQLLSGFQLNRCVSYTTRENRGEGDTDHKHVSVDDFLALLSDGVLFEYTFYNGNFYGYALSNPSTVCILEPVGLAQAQGYFERNDIPYVSVYLDCNKTNAFHRMIGRGDDADDATNRSISDARAFDKVGKPLCDYVVDANRPLEQVTDDVIKYVMAYVSLS